MGRPVGPPQSQTEEGVSVVAKTIVSNDAKIGEPSSKGVKFPCNRFDPRTLGAYGAPCKQGFDIRAQTFETPLDTAVVTVSHPSGDLQFLGHSPGVFAKGDPLYCARDSHYDLCVPHLFPVPLGTMLNFHPFPAAVPGTRCRPSARCHRSGPGPRSRPLQDTDRPALSLS